jgi:hypothetical protein
VLAKSFREGEGERVAVALHGIVFWLAAVIFNVIWWYVCRDRGRLAGNIGEGGVRSVRRRFQLALAWIGLGTLLGAFVPLIGVAVIAAFVVYYWLPISGELSFWKSRE